MTFTESKTPSTDLKLIQKISTGDDIAFVKLYEKYHIPLYNFIMRLTQQNYAAEDLLQEVFLAVWKSSRNFKGKSSVKTWIFRIAYHQAISWLRKNQKINQVSQNIDDIPITSEERLPESTVIEEFQKKQIESAIQRLSPNHRSVIELTFVHGFSYQEIAKIMDCPVGTVKSRMSYAIAYLKTDISTNLHNEF